jgi:choline dehydrogenase
MCVVSTMDVIIVGAGTAGQVTASNVPGDPTTGPTLVLAVAITRPASVGRVRLRSRDPRVPVSIDYNLLAASRDRRRMVEGVKLARQIAGHQPLVGLLDREIAPGSTVLDDAALSATIESNLDTYHHGSTTVPMGGSDDPHAVVDGSGLVRGLRGLSVIDASTLPEIPSTPTNLTTLMVAERLAQRQRRAASA